MGCGGSKLDEQPAVALCKERCAFLEKAVSLRFEFAESLLDYVQSLNTVGQSFHYLILETSDSVPALTLPAERKGDPDNSSKRHMTLHSRSHSGSHLHFHSDSDSDSHSEISHFHLRDHQDSSLSPLNNGRDASERTSVILHMNFMKSSTTTSVVYEQRPVISESVYYFGPDETASNPYSAYSYHGSNQTEPSSGGFYGYLASSTPVRVPAPSSSTKPPPSPPRASAWDFLNLFDTADRFYGSYGNMSGPRSLNEVREDEEIPDLEDEEDVTQQSRDRSNGHLHEEAVKEINSQHSVDCPSGSSTGTSLSGGVESSPSRFEEGPNVAMESDTGGGCGEGPLEYEVHVLNKNVDGHENDEELNHVRPRGPLNLVQLVTEIKTQFEKASSSAGDVLHLLGSDEQPHQSRRYGSNVLSGVKNASIVSSLPSVPKNSVSTTCNQQILIDVDGELNVSSMNLSSTMQKLFLWEKKLYIEVKAEEKLRVAYEKNCKKLKRLDEKGAEAHKVDATRTVIMDLSTKMRMAIQVVDKISVAMNKIRDEELWPRLHELIIGLTKMWKSMLAYHHIQREAVEEARSLGSLGASVEASDAYLVAMHGLVKWISAFSNWVSSQKGYVRALNNWLVGCILYEPEETADGPVPFSPGRVGAPPVFVICHQWAQSMDRISEKEVTEAMWAFTVGALGLCERGPRDSQQRVVTNKDLESKGKSLQKEDARICKELMDLEKQIVRVGVCVAENGEMQGQDLRGSMLRLFEAMECFMSDSVAVYEELLQRSGELENAEAL